MLFADVFPRNADGTLKTKTPCQTPGCKSPNWHICLDKNDPSYKKVEPIRPKGPLSWAHRHAISVAQRARHARFRELSVARDNEILRLYTEESLPMHEVANRVGLSRPTVNKILKRYQQEGRLQIRPPGYTLSRPGTR